MKAGLKLTRSQILAFRRRTSGLDERMPRGAKALRQAAWAGLQDSMPRAALLSIHARMAGAKADSWEDPSLVHIWGPRFSTYLIAKRDLAIFTLSRLPDEPKALKRAQYIAARLTDALAGGRMKQSAAARAMRAGNDNQLRYAGPTGRVVIRWDGARQPEVWAVPAPEMEPHSARLELARRYLHVFGPSTEAAFANWAGIGLSAAMATFESLRKSLTLVHTPIGDGWMLSKDEPLMRKRLSSPAPARLLPSGDTWFLLQGTDRELLIPNKAQRSELWTSRVWPGAVLVEGETVGTWRRAGNVLSVRSWRRLSRAQQNALEDEARSFALPGVSLPIELRWERL
jgi:hypothetical protein